MRHRWLIGGALILGSFAAVPAYPCTSFFAEHAGKPVFGKSYDWTQSMGYVVINPRGLRKTALSLNGRDTPAMWTSRYASLTFNQYGVELPNGGVNEKGLAVEVMGLDATKYPAADGRPSLNELQWVQFALDGSARVSELVTAVAGIRVSQAYTKIHYLACDTSADCAVFEYLEGKLVVTRAESMPAKVLTNSTYAQSAATLAGFDGFGGTALPPTSSSSLDRFVRAATGVRTTSGTTIPASAFAILDDVAQPSTRWSIVYVLDDAAASFRTRDMPSVKSTQLRGFNLDCSAPRQLLDINDDGASDVTSRFIPYTQELNRQLIARSTASIASSLPANVVDLLAQVPDSYPCTGIDGGPADAGTDPAAGAATNDSAGDSGCSCQLSARRASPAWLLPALGWVALGRRRRAGQRGQQTVRMPCENGVSPSARTKP